MWSEASNSHNDTHKVVSTWMSNSTLRQDKTAWMKWKAFWIWMCTPTNLKGKREPIPCLHIFTKCIWSRVITANRHPIKNISIEQYFRSVGKMFSAVRTTGPRLNTVVSLNFCLERHIVAYICQDTPPSHLRRSWLKITSASILDEFVDYNKVL